MLHATFTLRPGQIVYVNLFALDVSGNFSRVTKLIVAPGKIVAKSKRKVAKKKAKSTKKAQQDHAAQEEVLISPALRGRRSR